MTLTKACSQSTGTRVRRRAANKVLLLSFVTIADRERFQRIECLVKALELWHGIARLSS